MTDKLFLHVPSTPLEFDPFVDGPDFGGGIAGTVPTTSGAPLPFVARLDPRTHSVVMRVGKARPRAVMVSLSDLLTAWLYAEDRVTDPIPEREPDYSRSLFTTDPGLDELRELAEGGL